MVVAQQQYLYAGFGSTGQLFGWSIDANGNLTAIPNSPYSLPFLGYAVSVGQDNIITNPAGTLLFISDSSQGLIYVFAIGSDGSLTTATGSPFATPPLFVPINLTTDGLGKYLYATNGTPSTHTGSAIAAYAINSGSGNVLTAVQGSPFVGLNYSMWQLRGEPTGQFLIGTSGRTAFYSGTDDDHLYVFGITQSGAGAGAIAPVGSPFATTYAPLTIAAQSNLGGNLVYSFGINDGATAFNPVEGFSLSSAGALTAVTCSPFSGLGSGSWGQFDESGALLFDYASILNTTTNTITTQLSPLSVASTGGLSQSESTLTIASPGFWVVTDPK
jgi:hypothetical protein